MLHCIPALQPWQGGNIPCGHQATAFWRGKRLFPMESENQNSSNTYPESFYREFQGFWQEEGSEAV